MKRRIPFLPFLVIGLLLVASCGEVAEPAATTTDDDPTSGGETTSQTLAEALAANADPLDDPGEAWRDETLHELVCQGDAVDADADGVSWADGVLTIADAGCYRLSGSLDDGRIVVDAEDEGQVTLVLAGLTVHSSVGAPLCVLGSDLTLLYLEEGTVNTFGDPAQYVDSGEDDPNAAVYSKDDLVVDGPGGLAIVGSCADGLTSKDQLLILDGVLDVTAADDGIRGKEALIVRGGTIAIACGGDGLRSDEEDEADQGYVYVAGGVLDIDAGDEGVQGGTDVLIGGGELTLSAADDGIKSEVAIVIEGGLIEIEDAEEGIEAPLIAIADGEIHVQAADDALNATYGLDGEADDGSELTIAGGYVHLSTSSGDGVDGNGSFTMSGGTLVVHGPPSQPEVGIDVNGAFDVDGGFMVVSAIRSNMIESPRSSSAQRSLLLSSDRTYAAGTIIRIEDADGTGLLTFAPGRRYSSITFSSDDLSAGATYKVYTGGSCTGALQDGLYTGGTYAGGTLRSTFTDDGIVASVSF